MQDGLHSRIEHTLLKADATSLMVEKLCQEARENQFFGVCVNSVHLPKAVLSLQGSSVATVAVVGFPLGAMATASKSFETRWCVDLGATEIDMVLQIGFLKAREFNFVQDDIGEVVKAAQGSIVKVIIETALLTEEEKIQACQISERAGAHFVKTSTGFGGGGATVDDIALMRKTVASHVRIKASGGVKTREQALQLIAAGADRLGTSSGVQIVNGLTAKDGY